MHCLWRYSGPDTDNSCRRGATACHESIIVRAKARMVEARDDSVKQMCGGVIYAATLFWQTRE